MITLNIVSSGGAKEAECLVGPASPAWERPITSHLEVDPFGLYLTLGQEEVVDLNYVTKAYQCLRLRCSLNLHTVDSVCYDVFRLVFVSCRAYCSIYDYKNRIFAAACIKSNYFHLDEAKLSCQVILRGTIMSLLLSLANRKQNKTNYNLLITLNAVNFTPN